MTFKPLLAYTVPTKEDPDALKKLSYPQFWSPKLDGIRTLIVADKDGPVSRTYKRFPNEKVHTFLSGRPELHGLDGEIVFGPVTAENVFNHTQSCLMSGDGPSFAEADGKFMVFDDFTDPDAPFEVRIETARRKVRDLPADLAQFVVMVSHELVHTADDLSNIEAYIVEQGYEGVMVRNPGGRYKYNRSTAKEGILGKIKRFDDFEATIIGFEEMMHNDNEAEKDAYGRTKRSSAKEGKRAAGTLGKLILESELFTETFKCGSGFTAELKQDIWDRQHELLGAVVTLKYQKVGSTAERPRLPIFLRFRKD